MLKRSLIVIGLAACLAMTGTSTMAAEPQAKPALPTIVVLATGGTIAGAAATDTQAGYTSGQVGVEQLLAAVPQAKKLAEHARRADREHRLAGHERRGLAEARQARQRARGYARRRRRGHHPRHRHDRGDRLLPEPRGQVEEARRADGVDAALDGPLAPTARSTSSTPWRSPPTRTQSGAACSSSSTTGSTARRRSRRRARRRCRRSCRRSGAWSARSPTARPSCTAGPSASTPSSSEFSLDGVDRPAARGHHHGAREHGRRADRRGGGRGREGDRDRRRRQRQPDRPGASRRSPRRRRRASCASDRRAWRRASSAATSSWRTTRCSFVASLGQNPQKSRVLLRLALTKTTDLKEIQRYFIEY